MKEGYLNNILYGLVVVVLFILSFLVLKPILLSIVLAFVLAFIFSPVYRFFLKITKSPNFSATVICLLLILLIILPIWFFTPLVIDQSFKIYLTIQQTDFTSLFEKIFSSLFASEQLSGNMGGIFHGFVTKVINSFLNGLSNFILNFPALLLHSLVVLFTFYFALRDKDKIFSFIKSLSPFSREVESKLFKYSRDITSSVLYGQVVLGVIQGLVIAIGLFIFGVPNALLLSLLAVVAGILPIVGPMLVWIPVVAYLFLQANTLAAVGILIFGIIGSNIDNILRPFLVSKMAKIHSGVVLVGMIGGLFLFGILGLILGPLILSYLLIILEVYIERNNSSDSKASNKK